MSQMSSELAHASYQEFILSFSCSDQPGIVAAVAAFFSLQGFNIRESSQFEDIPAKRFFMRTELESLEGDKSWRQICDSFQPIADRYGMDWSLVGKPYRPKLVLAVSQWGHCLENLLNDWHRGVLPVDIPAVVSNHEKMRELCDWYGVPFHYLPLSSESKQSQEAKISGILQDSNADGLILARYMQILSEDFCKQWSGKVINIHHSFLPGFKGAKPYHQAFERGVKLIGATAHFVTSDLDEGPIIEQAVERVSHANSVEELVEIGRGIESVVLNRAVKWFAEKRVLMNGQRTIVFKK